MAKKILTKNESLQQLKEAKTALSAARKRIEKLNDGPAKDQLNAKLDTLKADLDEFKTMIDSGKYRFTEGHFQTKNLRIEAIDKMALLNARIEAKNAPSSAKVGKNEANRKDNAPSGAKVGKNEANRKDEAGAPKSDADEVTKAIIRDNKHYRKYAPEDRAQRFQQKIEKATLKLNIAERILAKTASDPKAYKQALIKYKEALLDVHMLRREIVQEQVKQMPNGLNKRICQDDLDRTRIDKTAYLQGNKDTPASEFLKERNNDLTRFGDAAYEGSAPAKVKHGASVATAKPAGVATPKPGRKF